MSLRAPEPGAAAEIDQHVGQVLHRQAVQRLGHRAQRGKLTDPAQRDRRPRVDVVDIGADGLADLLLPVRLGVDGSRMLAIRFSLFLRSSSIRHSSLLANCS